MTATLYFQVCATTPPPRCYCTFTSLMLFPIWDNEIVTLMLQLHTRCPLHFGLPYPNQSCKDILKPYRDNRLKQARKPLHIHLANCVDLILIFSPNPLVGTKPKIYDPYSPQTCPTAHQYRHTLFSLPLPPQRQMHSPSSHSRNLLAKRMPCSRTSTKSSVQ